MSSDAIKIGECMADIALRRAQRWPESVWRDQVHLLHGTLPASKNKYLACNASLAMTALDEGDVRTVNAVLDYHDSIAHLPFLAGEALTPEEAYRSLQAYGSLLLMGVAWRAGRTETFESLRKIVRAHVAWLLAGIGTGPGRAVRNHQKERSNAILLVGDGPPHRIRYVAQAGMRGVSRVNKGSGYGQFLFTERIGLSAIVYQALGYDTVSVGGWIVSQHDAYVGFRRRFGDDGCPVFGLTDEERGILRAFFDNPASVTAARALLPFLLAPDLPFIFDRYEDGSVVSLMLHDRAATFDPWMLDAWIAADGSTRLATCEDGYGHAQGMRQRGSVNDDGYLVEFVDGSHPIRLPRLGGRIAHRFRTDGDGRVWLEVDGEVQSPATPPRPPSPPPPSPPPPPAQTGNGAQYLGTFGSGRELVWVYGATDPGVNLRLREIHVDAGSGLARRWVVERIP